MILHIKKSLSDEGKAFLLGGGEKNNYLAGYAHFMIKNIYRLQSFFLKPAKHGQYSGHKNYYNQPVVHSDQPGNGNIP